MKRPINPVVAPKRRRRSRSQQELVAQEKSVAPAAHPGRPMSHSARPLVPRKVEDAMFIDGARAKILRWGKVPK